jgi:hypothetical protein
MTKSKWFLAVTLFTLFLAGIMARSTFIRASQLNRPAYTLSSQATQYDPDSAVRPLYIETLYMSATGNWHNIKQYASGAKVEAFGTVGQGVFAKREGDAKMNFLSSYDSPKPILTAAGFQKSSGFLRTETVLGYPAFVTKADNDSRVEFYCAPIIGGANIKIVHRNETKTVVVEPTSLVLGEPDSSLIKMPVGLPVSYDNFNRLHSQ